MPTQGGPSRRSHTKSRKGCKTCKRRHIRCDETFPQCRNCTKHQVRCDYMESFASNNPDSPSSPDQPSVVLTPSSESRVDAWQQTGQFPYPDLNVYPAPPTANLSRDEMALLHHVSRIASELRGAGTARMTLWADRIPNFLGVANTHLHAMHALMSFSANNIAWTQGSNDMRNIHIHHGAVALGGLHDAIGQFSGSNADAVLASSLLLSWQANDLRSWTSLRGGVQTVLQQLRIWEINSAFADFVIQDELVANAYRSHRRQPSVSPVERVAVLQRAVVALQALQISLIGHDLESLWVGNLLGFVQTRASQDPPASPQEQFEQLYHLRKWLFWVPEVLLHRREATTQTVLTIMHFYATAIALEPLFPDLGPSFCAAISLAPLEFTLEVADRSVVETMNLVEWPQQVVLAYRSRSLPPAMALPQEPTNMPYDMQLDSNLLSYTSVGNLSPAFAPSTLNYATTASSSQSSSFLEVPSSLPPATGSGFGFGFGTQTWGVVPSPALPPSEYTAQDDLTSAAATGYGFMPLNAFGDGLMTLPDNLVPLSAPEDPTMDPTQL